MTDALETELDRLFRLPPAELVEARNALADTLRRAGDKAGAARIKALKRAVPVAWAINQVHFTQPLLLERARVQTNSLRELQAQRGVDARQLARAVEQQRASAQAVVDAALRAGRGAGLSDAVLQPRKLLTTLQAWLAGKGDEAPGRMTQELEASGFDAFAGMTLSPAPAVAPISTQPVMEAVGATSATSVVSADASEASARAAQKAAERAAIEAAERAAIERATQLLAEREQLAAAARERVELRAAEQGRARQAREHAQASVRDAERRVVELRSALEQREHELERFAAALEEAQAAQVQADEEAATARAELAARSKK
jgi:hypothetical protein